MGTSTRMVLIISSTEATLNGMLALLTTLADVGPVLVAREKELAFQLMRNHRPPLVILEMDLPEMEVLIYRFKEEWEDVQILTLVDDTLELEIVKSLGADHVLRKGFKPPQFIQLVEEIIKTRGAAIRSRNKPKGGD